VPAPRPTLSFDLRATLAACQQGDREAFRRLFEAHRHRVWSNARHVLRDDALAKDATQAIFVRVWQGLPRFDLEGDFSSWLYRITINTCFTLRARERRQIPVEHVDPPNETSGSSRSAQECAVHAQEVQAALGRLRRPFAEILVLRHLEGLAYDEIATVLGCSLGTVASRLSRAHEAMSAAFSAGEAR
jgi:RNA polymerase sigma-70 factor (ECF subfamily)